MKAKTYGVSEGAPTRSIEEPEEPQNPEEPEEPPEGAIEKSVAGPPEVKGNNPPPPPPPRILEIPYSSHCAA